MVIHGPPKSGKTTLIKSLIKHYTKQTVSDPKGPITVRTGKRQRVTLIECPNEINAMADLAKTADLVLCMIDGSLGFEMETFEFLSIMQIHGFPRCVGVCSHLDFYKDNKILKKLQRKMKKRFASETNDDSRLFWLRGLKYDNYIQKDIVNLARYISIIQPRKLEFKKENPHLVLDRFELLTDGILHDEDKVEIAMFGYARGGSFR